MIQKNEIFHGNGDTALSFPESSDGTACPGYGDPFFLKIGTQTFEI